MKNFTRENPSWRGSFALNPQDVPFEQVNKGRVHKCFDGLRLRQVLAIFTAGTICGLLTAMFAVSTATLLFPNELSGHIAVGIGMCLIGSMVLNCVTAVTSSCPGVISASQEITAVTFAVIATSIYTVLSGASLEKEVLSTIIAMIALSTCVTGIALFAMGSLRAGRLIRFIPYPVMGGFLAGMGWLIVQGAMGVILGEALSLQNLHVLVAPSALEKWLPAFIFACAVGFIARRNASPFILPIALFLLLGLFHLTTWILGLPMPQLQQDGWLFLPPQGAGFFIVFESVSFENINWSAILNETPKIIALIAITAASVLFASNGIEISIGQQADLNKELRTAGIANFFAGAGGGAVGFQGLGLTVLAHQLGAPYRMVGITVAIICCAILFFGASLLSYLPVPLLGGLLLWMGMSLLYDWLIDNYAKMSSQEYCIVLLMVFLISIVGLVQGVLAGIFAAAILFAVEYSKIAVVKHALTGDCFHSSYERNDDDRAFLNQQGKKILILRLQGFVFFGTVHRLQKVIADRIGSSDQLKFRFVLMDCQDLTGVDSSAMMSFCKISDMINQSGGALILTNLDQTIQSRLGLHRSNSTSVQGVQLFEDLDSAMIWAEDQILSERVANTQIDQQSSIAQQLAAMLDNPRAFEIMAPYLEKVELKPQTQFIEQGAQSRDIYFIETGTAFVHLKTKDNKTTRLRTLGPGTVVGEISFCLDRPRIASVSAEAPATVWRLSQDQLQILTSNAPTIASDLHKYLLRILAERLSHTNRLVKSLTK